MGQKLVADKIAPLTLLTTTTASIGPSFISSGARQYYNTSQLLLNIATLGLGGVDVAVTANSHYTVFAIPVGGALQLLASKLSAPTGYSVYTTVGYLYINSSSQIHFTGYKGSKGILAYTAAGALNIVVPPDTTCLDVETIGGGGGGGRHSGTISGQGGSSGGYARKSVTGLVPLSSVACSIGAGGAGATAADLGGGVGGTTNFGSYLSALGGNQGTVSFPQYQSRRGGNGVGGDINLYGSYGAQSGNYSSQSGGQFGAPGYMGYGGSNNLWPGTVNLSTADGIGAGGAGSNGPNVASAGAPGGIIMSWTYGV